MHMDVSFTSLAVGAAIVTAVVTGLAIFGIRGSLRGTSEESVILRRGERWAVSLVGAGALAVIPLSVWGVIGSAVFHSNAVSTRVDGLALSGGAYPPFLAASDAPVDAGYESAWVDVANLPPFPRVLLWLEEALPSLASLVIAIAVMWLALALLRGAPFVRAFPFALGVVALVIVGAGLGAQVAGNAARAQTVAFLDPSGLFTDGRGSTEALSPFYRFVDLGPVGWGLGIALVAAAFSIGTRLQRDTRGLV
jgi:hypothetical protein